MHVVERYTVPFEQLPSFLAEHVGQRVVIKESTENSVKFNIIAEYTEPEFHMGILLSIVNSHSATEEEKNAADYGINAIKTLIDMGVLNDDKE